MPQPRDITHSIYKRKKLKTARTRSDIPVRHPPANGSGLFARRLGFSSFSFAVSLLLVIAMLGQFALMTLFNWL